MEKEKNSPVPKQRGKQPFKNDLFSLSAAVLPDLAQLRENGASGTPSRAF